MTYGCFDRAPYLASTPVQDGWYMDGYTRTPRMVSMPFRMSPDCNYTLTELGEKDEKCHGCKWKAGTGVEAPDGNVPVGDSLATVCGVEGGSDGSQDPARHGSAADVAEQRRHLEQIWPSAAVYQPTKEN